MWLLSATNPFLLLLQKTNFMYQIDTHVESVKGYTLGARTGPRFVRQSTVSFVLLLFWALCLYNCVHLLMTFICQLCTSLCVEHFVFSLLLLFLCVTPKINVFFLDLRTAWLELVTVRNLVFNHLNLLPLFFLFSSPLLFCILWPLFTHFDIITFMCTCMHLLTHTCSHPYMHVCPHVHEITPSHTHTCTHTHACTHTHTHARTHAHMHTHTHTHARMHACMHARTHAHT